jgi:hypothetical protein
MKTTQCLFVLLLVALLVGAFTSITLHAQPAPAAGSPAAGSPAAGPPVPFLIVTNLPPSTAQDIVKVINDFGFHVTLASFVTFLSGLYFFAKFMRNKLMSPGAQNSALGQFITYWINLESRAAAPPAGVSNNLPGLPAANPPPPRPGAGLPMGGSAILLLILACLALPGLASAQPTAREQALLPDNTTFLALNETPLINTNVANADTTPAAPGTNSQTTLDIILADLPGITNIDVSPYGTYAPKTLPGSNQHWGGGLLAVWNVREMVGLGMGLDWLGQLSLVSVNVTFQAPFHPDARLFPTLEVVPIVLIGGEKAYSGNGNFNGSNGTVYDVGAFVRFGHLLGGQFNLGGTYGKWTIGDYQQSRYHISIGWMYGF